MMPHDTLLFLDESGHVPAAEMARYIDGTSDRGARSLVTHHLAACEECREELTALHRLVPKRARMTTRFGALLGAAAAITLITLSWRGTVATEAEEMPAASTRAIEVVPEIAPPFPIVSPQDGALLSPDSLRLTWRAAGHDVAYRVVLFDEGGGVVFSSATSDTSTTVPASAFATRTARGVNHDAHPYHWSVEALLLDGRSTNTGLHRLRIR